MLTFNDDGPASAADCNSENPRTAAGSHGLFRGEPVTGDESTLVAISLILGLNIISVSVANGFDCRDRLFCCFDGICDGNRPAVMIILCL